MATPCQTYVVQNCDLCLITGAAKSTVIQSIELQSGIEPLSDYQGKLL